MSRHSHVSSGGPADLTFFFNDSFICKHFFEMPGTWILIFFDLPSVHIYDTYDMQ